MMKLSKKGEFQANAGRGSITQEITRIELWLYAESHIPLTSWRALRMESARHLISDLRSNSKVSDAPH